MTTAQIVETSVTNNSCFQNYTHPDDHTTRAEDYVTTKYYYILRFNNLVQWDKFTPLSATKEQFSYQH